jgi:hypothetical protein
MEHISFSRHSLQRCLYSDVCIVGFALMASYVANHIPVICPAGLLRSTNSFLMNLSCNSGRKVTKRTPPRNVCPSGSRGIRLCLRAVLTRRPGSTGLNPTSLSAIFFIFLALPKPNASANFTWTLFLPLSSVAWMERSVIRELPAILKGPGFHFVASGLQRRFAMDGKSSLVEPGRRVKTTR